MRLAATPHAVPRHALRRAAPFPCDDPGQSDEVERWKLASGLERGGDPDGVTPDACRKYWGNFERINTSPVLHWSHVSMGGGDSGWNLLQCKPDHPQQPTLCVERMPDQYHAAQVTITCRERDGDDEIVIADVIVPYRDDIPDCSICGGNGWVAGADTKVECPWCMGDERTPMDEAKEIACAIYWSWIRSPNGGGKHSTVNRRCG